MGRLLVVLAFACLVGAFFMLSRNNSAPPQSGTITNTNAPKQGNARAAKSSQPPASNPARAAERRAKMTVNPGPSSAAAQSLPAATAAAADAEPDQEESASQPTVKDEGTPIYSLNTRSSKVVKRLKKGERVNTDVEVLDSEGRWSLVKGQGKSGLGFVRGENLEKTSKNTPLGKAGQKQHP